MRLQIIGGGKMGEALLGGLIESGWAGAAELAVVEPVEARRTELSTRYPELTLPPAPRHGVDAAIAVKPQHVGDVATGLGQAGVERVLSIAAGVTTAFIESRLGEASRVVRAMPNTPALVGEGMAAISPGANATSDDVAWAEGILLAVGRVAVVDEAALDAVTGLSGSGPAYLFYLGEAMVEAGVGVGLDQATAELLTEQTLYGAAALLRASSEDARQLRTNVTSPGGTTAAAIAVLDERSVRQTLVDAIGAATRRSRELGSGG